jgi:purine-binding chemotaxis protein CheW
VLGCLADSVQEVIELSPGDISAAPKIGTRLRTEFIRGMGKRDDRFIILLDIDKVFSAEELSLVKQDEPTTP